MSGSGLNAAVKGPAREKKMFKKMIIAAALGFVWSSNISAQTVSDYDQKLAGSAVYSDPGFQEFVETSYGYLSFRNRAAFGGDFRDALASPASKPGKYAGAGAKTKKYVFISIMPKANNYSALVRELSASVGFVLSGERTIHLKNVKRTRIVGWVKAAGLETIRKNPGVARVTLEHKVL